MVEYERRPDGIIALYPVMGWTLAEIAGMSVMLRVTSAGSEEELQKGGVESRQFLLTPAQASELGAKLQREAQRILGLPAPGPAS